MPVSPARIPALAVAVALLAMAPLATSAAQSSSDDAGLAQAVDRNDVAAVRERGIAVMPALARLYTQADPPRRARLAGVFYQLGWESEEAKDALMADARTP